MDDRRHRLGRCVVPTVHPAVVISMVGTGGDFATPKKLMDDVRKLREKSEAVFQEHAAQISPKASVLVGEHDNCAPSALNSAAVAANKSALRVKRSGTSKVQVLPRSVTGRGPQ